MKRAAAVAVAFATATFLRGTGAAADDPAPPEGVEEVKVHGRKAPRPARTTMGGAEVRQIPGAFGDAFRAVEILPGVTPIVSGLPFFFVRGAPPGNNGYFLDGVRVPLLYHVGLGPSVVHPGLVQRVDFYPGGYPARFGRFTGGILSGETRAPTDVLHAEGNLRLFDAGALVEAPFANGRGTALVAGRYSYTAAIVSLAAPEAKLDYWDYQGRVTFDVTPDDTASVFAFGSYDFLGEVEEDKAVRTIFATQFHRLDLRWDHRLPKRGKVRIAATLGVDSTATEDIRGVRNRMLGARMVFEQPASDAVLVRGGLDTILDHYDAMGRGNGLTSEEALFPPRNDLVAGAHLDAVIRAAPRWEVTPGVRADYFAQVRPMANLTRSERRRYRNAAVPAVDPRLLSRLTLARDVTLVSTFGVTHQPPAFFVPIPGLQIGRLAQGLQTGVQASQGVEVGLPLGLSLTPTVFYHHYSGLTDYTTSCGDISNEDEADCIDRRVRGRTVGLELLLRRSLTKRLTGWLSYTLSRTTRSTQVFLGLPGRSRWADIPGDFDRTHVLNLIGAYDLGRGWRAGARFFFYTGRPYSRRALGYPVPPYNDRRMPDYHRFDLRLEKGWRVGEAGRVALVFEWLNATLRKEVTSVSCSTPAGRRGSIEDVRRALQGNPPPELLDECSLEEIGPVTIPSVGVEGQF